MSSLSVAFHALVLQTTRLTQTVDIYHHVFYSGGSSLNNLIELKTININPTDTNALLLNDCTEVGPPDVPAEDLLPSLCGSSLS